MRQFLLIAQRAARIAGAIHARYFRKECRVRQKSASYDLVTCADTQAERAIVRFIRKHYPLHNFLAEEGTYSVKKSEFTWIIDPLDGTNNFACGIPLFCVSIALKKGDEIIVSAVYDVTRDELFWAQKGRGAFLNGKRIHVNGARCLSEALLITGFYYDRGKNMIDTLAAIKRFHFKRIIGIRRFGAAALDLCYVASGRAAGFWEFCLKPWDFAAGKLLVEEAGGIITGKHAEEIPLTEQSFIIASNAAIHPAMVKVINERR
ncbi:MAG TPA: inositol monophosphatase family protein [Candidatus Omnitrophota bacterium]|nr:inositol monophosphatase family protein [Candidatus Omnitrophota bacterium]HPT06957.1 inositol monophosphatase family protein [Candidatus Omnitrophota bacterium]